MKESRQNSYAVGGGAFGDEGKGKFTDTIASEFNKDKHPLVVYRVNGGANAGHTLVFDGKRIALHQIPCGAFTDNTSVVLGKGMVLHPRDLLEEIAKVKENSNNKIPSSIKIDSMAALALDTHRAYEGVLKKFQTGSSGATGRGISPAYSDIILRQPVLMRDLERQDWEKFGQHYDLYQKQISGLGEDLSSIQVATLNGKQIEVGTKNQFINRLKEDREQLLPFIQDVHSFIRTTWNNEENAYIFEMAQAIGLDYRWGIYPDVTASDTTFNAITASTEGIVDFRDIQNRISTIKATYMSSVGRRVLPTAMIGKDEELANKIRKDASEYGATTKRPRDIAFLDIPALEFYQRVSGGNEIAITHMDIVYPNTPIKICTGYEINGKPVDYRPDQEYLDKITPIYINLPTWDQKRMSLATDFGEVPKEAKDYLEFIDRKLKCPVAMISNGPRREQIIRT